MLGISMGCWGWEGPSEGNWSQTAMQGIACGENSHRQHSSQSARKRNGLKMLSTKPLVYNLDVDTHMRNSGRINPRDSTSASKK